MPGESEITLQWAVDTIGHKYPRRATQVARKLHETVTSVAVRKQKKRGWGQLRRLPSDRWQASYTGPDLVVHRAPRTFDTSIDAEGYLAAIRRTIDLGTWKAPAPRHTTTTPRTVQNYAERWLEQRSPLKPRTRELYGRLIAKRITPKLGHLPLEAVTTTLVREWFTGMDPDKPTARAHSYALLRTILGTAVDDGIITSNPCRIRGAGQSHRAHEITLLTAPELVGIVNAMPEELRVGVLLSAWCGLRYGELAELRRKDVEPDGSVIHVRRGVVYIDGMHLVSEPKSKAGVRDIAVPPHLAAAVVAHLHEHTGKLRDALLFPAADGAHLPHWRFRHQVYKAARTIGRDDVHVHDLRHLGAVLAAQSGATLKELMARMGHTSPAMSMRYQHVAAGRDVQIAAAMSALVEVGP